jgi:hypothetical protein
MSRSALAEALNAALLQAVERPPVFPAALPARWGHQPMVVFVQLL